jgi:hypothetical protein
MEVINANFFGVNNQRLIFYIFRTAAWLQDGLFSNKKTKLGKILEGLAMEDVGIF